MSKVHIIISDAGWRKNDCIASRGCLGVIGVHLSTPYLQPPSINRPRFAVFLFIQLQSLYPQWMKVCFYFRHLSPCSLWPTWIHWRPIFQPRHLVFSTECSFFRWDLKWPRGICRIILTPFIEEVVAVCIPYGFHIHPTHDFWLPMLLYHPVLCTYWPLKLNFGPLSNVKSSKEAKIYIFQISPHLSPLNHHISLIFFQY